ncbi:MAG: hypothetical protein JNK61_12435 [Bacteroidia bacterium]|nr:hypothetical protein [Bacteroidia bacterium]
MNIIKLITLTALFVVCGLVAKAVSANEPAYESVQLDARVVNEVTETFTKLSNYDTPLIVVKMTVNEDGSVVVTDTNNNESVTCKAVKEKLESLFFADAANTIAGKEFTYAFRIKPVL